MFLVSLPRSSIFFEVTDLKILSWTFQYTEKLLFGLWIVIMRLFGKYFGTGSMQLTVLNYINI